MTDTETVKPVRTIEAKTIVKQGSLGHPMGGPLADENVNKGIMGRIIGIVSGISETTYEDPKTGEVSIIKGLRGSFQAIPLDEKKSITTSARCGLPLHIIQPVIDLFESAPEGEKNITVKFAYDIGVERAKNATGYSWYGVSLIPLGIDDPLASFARELAAPAATAQLEDKPADPAPAVANEKVAEPAKVAAKK